MTGDTQSPGQRLARQGLTLPDPPAAVAAFAPYVRSGSTVYVSGEIAVRAGRLVERDGTVVGLAHTLLGQDATWAPSSRTFTSHTG